MKAPLIIDSDEAARDALIALASLDGEEMVEVEFRNWPRISIGTTERLSEVKCGRAIEALHRMMQREYAALCYDGRIRKLTDPERRALEPEAYRGDDGKSIVFDLSRGATAAARVVKRRAQDRAFGGRVRSLFAAAEKQTGDAGILDCYRGMVDKVTERGSPRDITLWGLALIIVGGLVLGTPRVIEALGNNELQLVKEGNAHQLRMAELSRTTIAMKGGGKAVLEPAQRKRLEADLAREERESRLMAGLSPADPMLRFVAGEANAVRPALLDMAPLSGAITFNGAQMDATSARATSKLLKTERKRDKGKPGRWVTVFTLGPIES